MLVPPHPIPTSSAVTSHLHVHMCLCHISCSSISPAQAPDLLKSSFLLSGMVARPVVAEGPQGSLQNWDNLQHHWEPGQGHGFRVKASLRVRCFLGLSGLTEMTHLGIHPPGISNQLGEIEALPSPVQKHTTVLWTLGNQNIPRTSAELLTGCLHLKGLCSDLPGPDLPLVLAACVSGGLSSGSLSSSWRWMLIHPRGVWAAAVARLLWPLLLFHPPPPRGLAGTFSANLSQWKQQTIHLQHPGWSSDIWCPKRMPSGQQHLHLFGKGKISFHIKKKKRFEVASRCYELR